MNALVVASTIPKPRLLKSTRIKWESKHKTPENTIIQKDAGKNALISLISTIISSVVNAPLGAIKLRALSGDLNLKHITVEKLYSGYWTNVFRFGPRHALEHTAYALLKERIGHSFAGSVATCFSTIVCHPFDRYHIRRTLGKTPCMNMHYASLGLGPAVLQSGLNGLLWYTLFENLKTKVQSSYMLCAICSIACNICTYPIDKIKTRCSAFNVTGNQALAKIINEPGGPYASFGIALLTSVPAHAMSHGTYTTLQYWLRDIVIM